MDELRVDIGGGQNMRLRRAGIGSPTILLDAGWAHWSAIWAQVQPKLAEHFQTCAFDRMGLGKSDLAVADRSTFQIMDEVQAALRTAGICGPFIYVGHSFGAVHGRTLAHRDPEVIGMVLVDPVVEALGVSKPFRRLRDERAAYFTRLLPYAKLHLLSPMNAVLRQPRVVRKLPKEAAREFRTGYSPAVIQTILGELGELDESMKVLASIGTPRVPFEILSASEDWLPGERTKNGETRVQAMHRKLAESVSHGAQRVVPKTTHDVHVDAPDSVVEAVKRLAQR